METDDHFYTLVRYVERNALRANLVGTADAWRRGILRGCSYGNSDWAQRTVASLGLESTLRPRDRPKSWKSERPDKLPNLCS